MSLTRGRTRRCEIHVSNHDDLVILTVCGILDWETASTLQGALGMALPTPRLLIDLRGVERIDAAGTGALITAHLRSHAAGTALAIAVGDPETAAVLHRARLCEPGPVLIGEEQVARWCSTPTVATL